MNAKEYLNQSYRATKRIQSMVDQLEELKTLVTKTSAVTNDLPGSPNRNIHKTENAVVKLLDLREGVLDEISTLLELKKETKKVIANVKNIKYKIVLEERYLCYKSWPEIAEHLDYSLRYVHMLHNKALMEVEPFIPKK